MYLKLNNIGHEHTKRLCKHFSLKRRITFSVFTEGSKFTQYMLTDSNNRKSKLP